jgi:hypothetical protein
VIDLREPNRSLWLWLFNDGGAWTAHDLARQLGQEVERTFNQLSCMERRGILAKLPPSEGSRRLRYVVTGTCLVPHGLHVAEVQITEHAEPSARAVDLRARSECSGPAEARA